MILGVAVFYIFNAIETQTAMMEVTQTKAAIIRTMNGVLSGVSVFVSLVLGYLIVYASRFMLKKRKKEFGIYLTLGMGRIRLAAMLWLETIWVGLNALSQSAAGRNRPFPAYVSGGFQSVSGGRFQV